MSEHVNADKTVVKRILTTDQKKELIGRLGHPWGAVDLLCDGFNVTLRVECMKELQYCVVVYVNGRWKGEWTNGNKEFPEQKFMRKSVRKIFTPKQLRQLEKILGKRKVAKDPDYQKTYTMFHPYFGTGRAAINHLCKVCDSIEIKKDTENDENQEA